MKRLLLAALLPVLLVPAAWLAAEWRLDAGVRSWSAAREREGWTVRSGPATRAGFPFEAALVLPDLALSSPQDPPPGASADAGPASGWLEWSVPRLELRVSPLHPMSLVLLPQGDQRLRLGVLPTLGVDAQDARIVVPLHPASGSALGDPVAATAAGLRVAVPGDSVATCGALSLSLALHPDAGRDAAAATVQLDAAGLVLPGVPVPLRAFSLAAVLEGPIAQRPTPAATAAAWRDGGGRILVQRLDVRWGDLAATGTATLVLDAALQPAAEATLHLAGYDAALDTLAASGTIGPGTAKVAHAVLGLMAEPGPGGTRTVGLPVTWRGGVVAAGQIPLLRTPAVEWSLGPD